MVTGCVCDFQKCLIFREQCAGSNAALGEFVLRIKFIYRTAQTFDHEYPIFSIQQRIFAAMKFKNLFIPAIVMLVLCSCNRTGRSQKLSEQYCACGRTFLKYYHAIPDSLKMVQADSINKHYVKFLRCAGGPKLLEAVKNPNEAVDIITAQMCKGVVDSLKNLGTITQQPNNVQDSL